MGEQLIRFRLLLRVLGTRRVVPAPTLVPIVAAVVRIPAEHLPQLAPRQLFSAPQDARGEQPRPRAFVRAKLGLGKHGEMREEPL